MSLSKNVNVEPYRIHVIDQSTGKSYVYHNMKSYGKKHGLQCDTMIHKRYDVRCSESRTQRSTKLSGKTFKFLYDDQSTCPKETLIIVFAVPIVCLDTFQI